MIATIVDTATLGKVILYSAGAGVGASVVFALAVYGATRSTDMRRAGQAGVATLYAAIAVLGAAATVGAVAYGIYLVTQKS
jgi:hypothetical protein